MHQIELAGRSIEYLRLPSAHARPGRPAMLFLHEGLGSISMWRDFPQRVADATGCEAVLYSRCGHGRSAPCGNTRTPRYLHAEALEVLPELLARLELDRPFLFGHSDGASIALIYAGQPGVALSGLIVAAPHVMVEQECLDGIRKAIQIYAESDMPQRLAKHHRDADAVFRAWIDIWLAPEFRDWNIEQCLPAISCPVLAVQGENDEYATMEQIDRIARLAPDVALLKLADCRHSPHKDQPEALIAAVEGFVNGLLD
ncbi:MAG: alpha/beta hydrolase [Rhodocyclaceae bacterium]|nr:alpha/beta hydrolase [Rhodocyclaceae bacterium]